LLEEQAANRVPELVPIRYGRMLVSPFTFYRGAAAIMATDLAGTPVSGITVQHGDQVNEGGGIRNRGTLTLTDGIVTANRASSIIRPKGGGIRNAGDLTVIRSRVADNTSELLDSVNQGFAAEGGGIASDLGATTTVSHSTFADNRAIGGDGADQQSDTDGLPYHTISYVAVFADPPARVTMPLGGSKRLDLPHP
jgi:hypothetical protein